MIDSLFEQLITLYILYYFDNYKSAYKLIKILSRKFGIFEFSRVTNDLIKRKHVIETTIHPMDYYAITPQGEVFLKAHLNELKQELKEKYLPNDAEYIKIILTYSDGQEQ